MLLILALTSLACFRLPFQFSEAGETQVMEINEAHSTGSPVALTLIMGGGKVPSNLEHKTWLKERSNTTLMPGNR